MNIKRILAIGHKELLHIIRDKRSLYLSLFMPVLLIIMLGYSINFDVDNIKICVVDQSRSSYSREITAKLTAGSYFKLQSVLEDTSLAIKMLEQGQVKAVLIMRRELRKHILRREPVKFQVLLDGSDNTSATIASAYLKGIIYSYFNKLHSGLSMVTRPAVTMKPRFFYNPELKSTNFVLPGLVVVVIAIIGVLLTTLTVAREWEQGTMEQLLTTPVKPVEIILGKMIPYMFIGLLQSISALCAAVFIFKVPIAGNPIILICYALVFQATIFSLGLFISAILKSQVIAMQAGMIAAFLPTFLLSGFVFPLASAPFVIRTISNIVPARYFLIIMRDIFLKGMMWHLVPAFALTLLTLILVTAASKKTAKEIG